ncbi:MAG: CocE/NonD family hydrolase [Candidatus Sulfotelmatobacter sp.]
MTALAVCALLASSTLLFFGTGPSPVCWLTWFAPLPVFLIAAYLRAVPTFAIAFAAWFIGCLNMWHYFRRSLEIPAGVTLEVLLLPSFVFGIIVLLHGQFIRRGKLWQSVLVVPTVWVLYEYVFSVVSSHRTFGNIGYTQMACLPALRLASAISIWGVSFCVLLLPASAAASLSPQGSKTRLMKALAVVGTALLIAVTIHFISRFRDSYLASDQDIGDYQQLFDRSALMIPMRDGVRLYTEIYTPKGPTQPLPLLMERTTYTLRSDATHYTPDLADFTEMFPDKYIFVFQEIRGRYSSEGQFVMFRPPRDRSDPMAIDEATDAYDTIDWLVRNVPHNDGAVGLLGISYNGWLATMALLDPHPALKAISEQGSPADQFLGDDFHHNGAFRLSYGFEFTAAGESSKTSFSFPFDKHDMFDWYLDLGPLSNVNALYVHGQLPTWNSFVTHPNYDEFWKKRSFHRYLSKLKPIVPTLNVAGWWDPEALYGPLAIYDDLEEHDTDHKNYLVVGPWNHGGWVYTYGSALGVLDFGSDTGVFFRQRIETPWFAYWLHGIGTLPLKKAMIFETGSNQWKSYDAWPPLTGTTGRKLYLRAHGQLSFDPPTETESSADFYISDPANPVPYRQRPVEETYSTGSRWHNWLLEDQRFTRGRPDVLTWSTAPLTEDVTVSGDIVAHLFAATSGTDSDWVLKLIDAYPNGYSENPNLQGYELIIADEVLRGRFHESFEEPKPLAPNRVTPLTIDLHTNDHTFLRGHRILVQVQSTWFPLIDRNPQKYVPNIFRASAADYQAATQQIYHSQRYPSNIEIPVRTH